MNEECYKALEYVIDNSNMEIITIEYCIVEINDTLIHNSNQDENIPEVYEDIIEQINRIKKIIEEKRNKLK